MDDFLTGDLADDMGRAGIFQDPRWTTCIACALVDRQNLRNAVQRSPQCEACFTKYCV